MHLEWEREGRQREGCGGFTLRASCVPRRGPGTAVFLRQAKCVTWWRSNTSDVSDDVSACCRNAVLDPPITWRSVSHWMSHAYLRPPCKTVDVAMETTTQPHVGVASGVNGALASPCSRR